MKIIGKGKVEYFDKPEDKVEHIFVFSPDIKDGKIRRYLDNDCDFANELFEYLENKNLGIEMGQRMITSYQLIKEKWEKRVIITTEYNC